MSRRTVGVCILAASVLYSGLDLTGWLHRRLLLLGVTGGAKRELALALGSLTFKAVVLVGGALLAFWPARSRSS